MVVFPFHKSTRTALAACPSNCLVVEQQIVVLVERGSVRVEQLGVQISPSLATERLQLRKPLALHAYRVLKEKYLYSKS